MRCEIVVVGWPGEALARGLTGFEVTRTQDRTRFTGWVADRSAFDGLVSSLRVYGVTLISARRLPDERRGGARRGRAAHRP